jgi:hypothetical protein
MRHASVKNAAITALVVICPILSGLAKGGATSNVPVTSTVHNTWNAVSPICSTPPCETQIRSDSVTTESASYVSTRNITTDIGSGSSGEWRLDLSRQSARVVWLSFSHPVSGSPASPAPDGYYSAFLFSRCFDGYDGTQTGWLSIKPGTSNNVCSMRATITVGSQTYYLVMSPNSSFPGTGWASVTCTAGDSSGNCTSWSATPYLDTTDSRNNAGVASLILVTNSHGTSTLTTVGQYYVTFRIDAVK